MLCTSPSGLPYCYLSPGLLITTDRVRPGGLLMYRRGAPVFRLEADQDNRLNLGLGYSGRLNQPIVILDLGSLLRSTLATLQQAAFNQSEGSITVRTRNGSVSIVLSTPTDQESPPIKSLMVVNSELGRSVTVVGIGVKSPPPLDLLNVDVDSVLKLGLPIRALSDQDVRRFDLFVPPDFATDPRERVAAQRLLELLINANERPEQRPKIDRRIQVRAELVAQAPTMR